MSETVSSRARLVAWLGRNGYRIFATLALCGAFFAWGLAAGVLKVFPYGILEKVAAASIQVVRFPKHTFRIEPEKFLAETHREGDGVVRYLPGKASPGTTFLVGFFDGVHGMRLIDMDGRVRHDWRVSFNAIWPESPHLERQPHDWDTEIHGAHLYPDGDVVFNFQYGGLVRIDRCGRVRWKLARQTHHAVHVDSEGIIWVPSRKLRETALDGFPFVSTPFEEEFILRVSPEDGRVLEEISILDTVLRSGFEGVMLATGAHDSEIDPPPDGDFTHVNDVEVLSPELAPAFPTFSAGDVLVSLRNLNLLVVMDPKSRRIKWSKVGPFLRQHDPDFLPNGRISVFDNRRDGRSGRALGGSIIREIDPATGEIRNRYGAERDEFFYTETMGDHQRLPNGNRLITESNAGYAFEVTREGEIVWSYVNRWQNGDAGVVSQAIRYPESYVRPEIDETCDG